MKAKTRRTERNSGVAIWRQIADEIRSDIMAGKLQPGARMPAEIELAEHFGVNRHTVRNAIAALTQEGVLRAEQGRGTFIANAKRLTNQCTHPSRISQTFASQTRETKGILLASDLETASPEIASALELETGQEVVRLETLHSADGHPLSRATLWLDAARFPDIAVDYAESGSIAVTLRKASIEEYFRKSTIISARHADADDRRYLKLSPGAIVLTAQAVKIDTEGRPVQYSLTRFPADRMEFSIETYPIHDLV
ncbi:phosphonate metabolism transcriptional regulator PhnF [Brucella melitensis]|uniref:phosphonate metabolism transcriptional regulator PhnF n=1 Tax=Brucella melitensis TaxID=29459 RepID=UPI000F5D0D54|nr:phosphonate metabolism transcriptional regulator PhnF [Brucella melitensis]AZH15889.1 phosphonate metabolism transcriptional regulator PhnF [Brucella melitensis]MWC02690.1 phosphonate metabolism transcriptional regulator PhnF [Brucella melitensis]